MGLKSCSGRRGVGGFPVDRGGFVRVDEDAHEWDGAVARRGRDVRWCR